MHARAAAGFTVPIALPYRFDSLLAFIGPRAFAGVEEVQSESYRRALATPHGPVIVEVGAPAGQSHLPVVLHRAQARSRDAVAALVQRFFDTERDPAAISAHLHKDSTLRPLLAGRQGFRIPGAWHPFELAVRAIVGQQVSVKAATTFASRLVIKYGEPLPPGTDPRGSLLRLFPSPARLARAQLTSIGLVRARAKAIGALARELQQTPSLFDQSSDLDQSVRELQRLPGVGAWTAHYIAMRALRHADAFPSGDLGLIRAYSRLVERDVSATDLQAIAERWRPWRAYAAMLLWTADPVAGG